MNIDLIYVANQNDTFLRASPSRKCKYENVDQHIKMSTLTIYHLSYPWRFKRFKSDFLRKLA